VKKIVVLLVVLALLLVAAPWGLGRLAEQRFNAGLDRFVEQAPYLTIVEREWTPGWFRSEQTVTFELVGPWLKAMNPATAFAEIAQAEAEQPGEQVDAAEGAKPPEAQAPDAAPVAASPMRFTVRNEILHGPVLWPASVGIARVNSKVVLSEATRQKLTGIFGTDEPVRISTRVGFLGGGSTRFFGDGQTIELPDAAGTLTYDDFELEIGYSKNLDDFDMNGDWPRIEANNPANSELLRVSGMSLVTESDRVQGEVYESDFKFVIEEVVAVTADQVEITIEGIHYLADSSVDDGFMNVGAKVGTGKVTHPALAELQFEVEEAHYDFSLRRLHVETLDKMMAGIKAAYRQPVSTIADVQAVIFAPMKQHGAGLLKHDPEFVIDRIGFVTPQGEGVIKGVLRFKGMNQDDFAAGSVAWLNKIEADVTIECAQKLIDKLPNGASSAGAMVEEGFARRDGDKLVSRIEYKQGEFKVNGKAQGIPGFGGPPPEQME
jgi:uncharacterized protein YdgA (DUF945 family)